MARCLRNKESVESEKNAKEDISGKNERDTEWKEETVKYSGEDNRRWEERC